MKKLFAILMVITTMGALCAGCGKTEKPVETEPEEFTYIEETTLEETTSEETTQETTEDLVEADKDTGFVPRKAADWKTAYAYYLEDYLAYQGAHEAAFTPSRFWLDDLDGDGTPELFLSTDGFHPAGVKIIFFRSSTQEVDVFPKASEDYSYCGYGVYGAVDYVPGKGLVISADAHMGVRMTSVYDFSDGSEKKVWSGEAVYPEFAMAEDLEEYTVNDKKVSRAEYEKQFAQYVPKEMVVAPLDTEYGDLKRDISGRHYISDEEGYNFPTEYREYILENKVYNLNKESIQDAFK